MGNRPGPRPHTPLRFVVTGGKPPEFDEHLLRHFLGLGWVPHHASHHSVHERSKLVVQLRERLGVAPTRPVEETSKFIPWGNNVEAGTR